MNLRAALRQLSEQSPNDVDVDRLEDRVGLAKPIG